MIVTQTDVGNRVRRLREGQGWTQGQLATYAKVDRSWISLLERGGIASPGGERLDRVARALGVTIAELLHGGETAPSSDPEAAIQRLAQLAISAIAHRIPIQDSLHAGNEGVEAEFLYVPPQWTNKRIVAIRVRGGCMRPLLQSGDVVAVHLDGRPVDGDLVAFERGGRAEVRLYDARTGTLTARDDSPVLSVAEVGSILPVVGIYKAIRDIEE